MDSTVAGESEAVVGRFLRGYTAFGSGRGPAPGLTLKRSNSFGSARMPPGPPGPECQPMYENWDTLNKSAHVPTNGADSSSRNAAIAAVFDRRRSVRESQSPRMTAQVSPTNARVRHYSPVQSVSESCSGRGLTIVTKGHFACVPSRNKKAYYSWDIDYFGTPPCVLAAYFGSPAFSGANAKYW